MKEFVVLNKNILNKKIKLYSKILRLKNYNNNQKKNRKIIKKMNYLQIKLNKKSNKKFVMSIIFYNKKICS